MSTNPTLAGILLGNLSNPDLEINLTKKEATYLKELIVEHPEILYKIFVIITRVTKDDNLKLQDIPQFILQISDVFKSNVLEHLIENISIFNLVEFTTISILDSGVIPLPDTELEITKNLLDSSFELLKMNIENVENVKNVKKEPYICFSLFPDFCNLNNK